MYTDSTSSVSRRTFANLSSSLSAALLDNKLKGQGRVPE